MAYEVVMSYHLHMPSYFLGTFTEYPEDNSLCVFGQVNPAPTVDKVTGHFSFDIPPTVSLGSTVMPPNLATSVSAPQLQKSHDWQLRESPRK